MDVLLRMTVEPICRPSTILRAGLNPGLLLALDAVCLRALERNPWDRFPTAEAFARALDGTSGAGSIGLARSSAAVEWAKTA